MRAIEYKILPASRLIPKAATPFAEATTPTPSKTVKWRAHAIDRSQTTVEATDTRYKLRGASSWRCGKDKDLMPNMKREKETE